MSEISKVPNHIAIIMDGNGRWAQDKGYLRAIGHENGAERIRTLVETCNEIGVKYLTLYTFSTENWSRPKLEVDFLMSLLKRFLTKEIPDLHKNNVKFQTIGRTSELSKSVKEKLDWARTKTNNNTGLNLTLALNYGSRTEIVDGINKIIEDVKKGLNVEPITEANFHNYLYDPKLPDPELLIRTAGELRVSNFLLWQISYAEIYVTDVFFPEFDRTELLKAINEFQLRKRRFGGLVNK